MKNCELPTFPLSTEQEEGNDEHLDVHRGSTLSRPGQQPGRQVVPVEQWFAWVPSLFVYIGNGIRHAPSEQRSALLTFLKNREASLIEQGQIQAVGFRSVGGN